jgi:hypothetical protein
MSDLSNSNFAFEVATSVTELDDGHRSEALGLDLVTLKFTLAIPSSSLLWASSYSGQNCVSILIATDDLVVWGATLMPVFVIVFDWYRTIPASASLRNHRRNRHRNAMIRTGSSSPSPTAVCVAGSGAGNYMGLCSFSFNYGICPAPCT